MSAGRGTTEAERLARVALSRACEPGEPVVTKLVHEHGAGLVHDRLLAGGELPSPLGGVAAKLPEIDPAGELERATRLGIRFVIPGDAEWPEALDDLARADPVQARGGVPLGLWVRGPHSLHQVATAVALVGSRSSTSYGEDVARDIAGEVAEAGWAVISGAAFGIDQAAHRGALSVGGRTVAVLACGVDRAYPLAHRDLLDHIAQVGLIVSEAAPGCAPLRLRFLARNRLIAALAKGTVVVEAAVRSGALNTANWTDRLHRQLMGVPGPVTSAPSAGVHQLFRTSGALVVTNGREVLEAVGGSGDHLLEVPRAPDGPLDELTMLERQVLDAVPCFATVQPASIARTAGVDLDEASEVLGRLRSRRLVDLLPTGWRLGDLARGSAQDPNRDQARDPAGDRGW